MHRHRCSSTQICSFSSTQFQVAAESLRGSKGMKRCSWSRPRPRKIFQPGRANPRAGRTCSWRRGRNSSHFGETGVLGLWIRRQWQRRMQQQMQQPLLKQWRRRSFGRRWFCWWERGPSGAEKTRTGNAGRPWWYFGKFVKSSG